MQATTKKILKFIQKSPKRALQIGASKEMMYLACDIKKSDIDEFETESELVILFRNFFDDLSQNGIDDKKLFQKNFQQLKKSSDQLLCRNAKELIYAQIKPNFQQEKQSSKRNLQQKNNQKEKRQTAFQINHQEEKLQKKIVSQKIYVNEQPNKLVSQGRVKQNIQQPLKQVQKKSVEMRSQIQVEKGSQLISQIKANQVEVIVKCLVTRMDQTYEHKTKKLKLQIEAYIAKYLKQNSILVLHPNSKISIIQDRLYQKSQNCGNYVFDPFCQTIRFYIKRKDQKLFKQTFKIIGKPSIKYQKILDQKQWSEGESLKGIDQIQKLIKIVGKKKQEQQAMIIKVINAFTKGQGVKLIRDLFQWQKSDFQKLQMQITWMYQIAEIIERIKDDLSGGQNEKKKSIKQKKMGCIKTANSHKILRYLVFKNYGDDELSKLSKINNDNLVKAINIVKDQIINDDLLNQLQDYFYQFTHVAQKGEKTFGCSRGLVLFGPPGTGKTQLTQALPDLIGFHLISIGLSAADFMKTHVGQSSRMIKDLVKRATLSPHLICSVGIDEVDGLVPDRKDKQEKNKGQGISMLLSVIGGNKDVSNLLFLTSTNHLKKIDQAIRRRLSGQFQVGRPNPSARRKLIEDDLTFLEGDPQKLAYIQNITTNFTGAALKRLNQALSMKRSKIKLLNGSRQLSIEQITQVTIQIAKQFSITLGIYTFPEIYSNRTSKTYIFSLKFLNKIANRFLLINKAEQQNQYLLSYANIMQKYQFNTKQNRNVLKQYYEVFKDAINANRQISTYSDFQIFQNWMRQSIKNFDGKIYSSNNRIQTVKILEGNFEKPTVLLVKEDKHIHQLLLKKFEKPIKNLYILYYIQQPAQNARNNKTKTKISQTYEKLKWQFSSKKPYSGRILVQLNDQARMAFQLNTPEQDQTKFSFRYFMKTQKENSPNDVLPELVQFFNQRQANFILLIDYQLVLQNAAYEQQKMIEIIQEKMSEAMNYNRVAVIINLDSLIVLSKSSSDSSMGRSTSYSVTDQNMYRLLLHYMKEFSMISKKQQSQGKMSQLIMQSGIKKKQNGQKKAVQQQKWIAIIAKNPQLVKLIKQDLSWPYTPQERQAMKEQQQLQKQKKCARCGVIYTEQDNRKQRKCAQHPGPLIDVQKGKLQKVLTVQKARVEQLKYKKTITEKSKSQSQELFIFACCTKGLNEQGQSLYYHITTNQLQTQKDQLHKEKESREQQWKSIELNFSI